ncbi:ATP-dependent DNA helicase RecG [Actinotignum sp. GS-2025b]|uniref:ATP-dependent DNA helicase RecG n=1 Tax=Actinotignum sp. GS-2025b TaxID=3427275 RepID=UPI003F4511D7
MDSAQAAAQKRGGTPAVVSDGWTALSVPLERALGKRNATSFARLGLHTVGELLYHLPFRYARRGELLPIEQVREDEDVTVIGRVVCADLRPMRARRGFILSVLMTDGARELSLTFFAKSQRVLAYHERRLQPGTVATFSGTVSSYRGTLQLTHPDYDLVEDEGSVDVERLRRPIPIYHASAALPSWKIERAVSTVLTGLTSADVPDLLPAGYRRAHGLPTRLEALRRAHRPAEPITAALAQLPFRHEEALVLHTVLARRRAARAAHPTTAYPPRSGGLLDAFDARLPFELTAGQRAVGEEISADLAATTPMQRLLQGDVGSGKTVVALRAMLQVVDGGGQAALLAPTEVLAAQHARSVRELLGDLGAGGMLGAAEHSTRVELLTGSLTASERRATLARIASGEAGIIIGTHALLSDTVQIPFLGLAVVDEQHRFGVDQRDSLARGVHTLVMTATPIPRTVAMTVFGDMAVSTLRELPGGRAGVSTVVVPENRANWIARMWWRAREETAGGGRVYVLAPRISENDDAAAPAEDPGGESTLATVTELAERLRALPQFEGIAVGEMHGRLSAAEKDAAMADFAAGRVPVLVSTTVIEVGVDVPQATMMIIMNAERFGLSQLHQLRGRIGRGSKAGLCLAVSGAPEGSLAAERLAAFAATTDGFALAEKDVELRSEGDVLGTRQAGTTSHLRFLSAVRDADIIATARAAATDLVERGAPPAELERAADALDTERATYLERG